MADDETRKRRPGCLARAIGSGLDGGIMGGAIGAIMASGTALQAGFSGGGLQLLARAGFRSAISFGGFLASYNGGICSLERMRGKRDFINPFVVGGG